MHNDGKSVNKKTKVFWFAGKWILLLALFLFTVFLIAHFALRYGIGIEKLSHSLRENWGIWLLVRLAIYAPTAFFLYRIQQRASGETSLVYKKLSRAALIGVAVVELINISQIVRA